MTNDETVLMPANNSRQSVTQKNSSNVKTGVAVSGKAEGNKPKPEPINAKKNGSAWKKVAVGGVSAVLLGGGALYAANAFGNDGSGTASSDDVNVPQKPEDVKVAEVSDDMSFKDAFDAARGQIGAGGLFRWHGGLYSTYSEDEWNALSDADKNAFAEVIRPEVRADELVAERMAAAEPDVTPVKEEAATETTAAANDDDVAVVSGAHDDSNVQYADYDSDVHVVGQTYVEGHQTVALDLNGNGDADVAVIDVNDNAQLDDPDIVVDTQGNYATVGQLAQGQTVQGDDYAGGYVAENTDVSDDPNLQQAAYDNPDLSPDMPDYMDDASMDTMV